MSDETYNQSYSDEDLLPEYDFTGGIRGKHYQAYRTGYTVTIRHADGTTTVQHFKPNPGAVVLAPDVQAYFPDAEAVNTALRGLIKLIPKHQIEDAAQQIDHRL